MSFVPQRLVRRLSPLLVAALCAGCATEERKPAAKPVPPNAVAAPAKPAPPPVVTPAPPPPPREAEPPPPSKAVLELRKGVQGYEDGDYKTAARAFRAALDGGLATGAERAVAHKHLAFMHCVANRRVSCRNEFRSAFAANPAFDLTPAEAGHPMWGPVFRQVKSELSKKRK